MVKLDYQPLVLVDTTNLPHDEWLKYRRKGIGGSDAAAVLGISPFMTARDLYYDKLGISAQSDEENWVAKEIGHLLEPLVASIFERRTGLKVYQRKVMFQHPQPFPNSVPSIRSAPARSPSSASLTPQPLSLCG